MPREKEPGMSIEEQKGKLRLEEIEEQAGACQECARVRTESGDPTTFCERHLAAIYGV